MKKSFLFILLIAVITKVNSQTTNISDTNFYNHLVSLGVHVIDTIPDNQIVWTHQISALKTLDISGKNISNISEIRFFTSLEELNCSNNNLSTLNINSNGKLIDLDCSDNSLTSLSLQNNRDLNNLNFSGNKLTGITFYDFHNIYSLDCSDNEFSILRVSDLGLVSLNASDNPFLTQLFCLRNELTDLDVSNTQSLEFLNITENQNLESVNISESGLLNLKIEKTGITEIDLSNTSLAELTFKDNYSTVFSLNNSPPLTKLIIEENQDLTEVSVSNSELLEELICTNNPLLTDLTISNAQSLISIDCTINNLSNLTITSTPLLETLDCSTNQLASIDLSPINSLITLFCNENELTSLNVSTNTSLEDLECEFNQLTILDLTSNTSLTDLSCGENSISSLYISGLDQLAYLSCYNNNLSTLSLDNFDLLEILDCESNNLNTLDVSNNILLEGLFCGDNNLESLDVSTLELLDEFACQDNQIAELDLRNNISLSDVDCSNNKLEKLNVKNGNNTLITEFFNSMGNPDLTCITVDDKEYSDNNWTMIDSHTSFSESCDFEILVFNKNGLQNYTELKMEELSISADGSSSTEFVLRGKDYDKLFIKISENSNNNSDVYGSFQEGVIENEENSIIYNHPKYFNNQQGQKSFEITLQVFNEDETEPLEEFPIVIVRPPLFMVHGIWSNGRDGFGRMQNYLLSQGMYDRFQTELMFYNASQSNKKTERWYVIWKNNLLKRVINKNISVGKFDVLAHSNGGLLTRQYIQGGNYNNDINKFITFNTPHSGSQLANLILDPFFEKVHPYMKAAGKDPTNGVLEDLKVDGDFIIGLNSITSQINQRYNDIAVHTITSTLPINYDANENASWSKMVNWIKFGALKPIEAVLCTDEHDVIVPLESQKGGSQVTTSFPNQGHTGSTENAGIQSKTKDLLNKNTNNSQSFSSSGFNPVKLNTTCNTSKIQEVNKKSLVESIIISEPVEGSEFSSGQNLSIVVQGSSGIENIVTSLVKTTKTYDVHITENASNDSFSFTVPNDVLGKLDIVSGGFGVLGYENFDSVSILVTTDATLDNIEIVQTEILVPEGSKAIVTILGYYDDGMIRNITSVDDLEYSFDVGNAEVNESGLVAGLNEGEDILTVSYLGKTSSVPVTVVESISLGIEDEIVTNNDFVVYPNPTENKINIKFPLNQNKAKLEIYTILGQLILNKEISNSENKLDISNLQNGLYLIKIKTESTTFVKRILKQ